MSDENELNPADHLDCIAGTLESGTEPNEALSEEDSRNGLTVNEIQTLVNFTGFGYPTFGALYLMKFAREGDLPEASRELIDEVSREIANLDEQNPPRHLDS